MTQPCVLVAEDEPIVAIDLCDTVEEAGYNVLGPHRQISSAMLEFQKHKPDVAILDVQLKDGVVFALAEKLVQENVPIIFHSGQFTHEDVVKRFPNAMTLQKPCPPSEMLAAVNKVIEAT